MALDISYGFTASASDIPGGPKMLRITDIQNNRVDWASVPRCECENPAKYILEVGDIVVARTGATTGKSFLLRHLPEQSVFASYLIRVRPAADVVTPEYLANYMRSPAYWAQITTVSKGTAQPGANASILGDLEVPLPPLAEQKRIVATIEQLTAGSQRAMAALDAVPALLDQLRQSILGAAFRGDLTADWRAKNPDAAPSSELLARIRKERRSRWESVEVGKLAAKGAQPTDDRWKERYHEPIPAEQTNLPDLPEGWCWATAEELTDASRSIIYGIIKAGPDYPGGVPYVRVTEVASGRMVLDELPRCDPARAAKFSRSVLAAGDILVSKDGTIGKVAFVPPELEGANINQHVLRVAAAPLVNRGFLARMIEAPHSQRWMTGEVRGIALQGVNVEDFRRLPIPLPPLGEQDAIEQATIQALKQHQKSGRAVADANAAMSQIEQAVLAKAFRGELVPQDPSDEPASVLLDQVRAARESSGARGPRGGHPHSTEPVTAGAEDGGNEDSFTVIRAELLDIAPKNLSDLDPAGLLDEVFAALWSLGPLEKEDAARRVAVHLRQAGYVRFDRLRSDGPLFGQVLDAVEAAVKAGRLDRPKRGYVRACKPDAAGFAAEDWRHALVASLGSSPTDRDDALRAAAEWARDNLGLQFVRLREDGYIAAGLRSAINSAIRRGEVVRHDARRISRAPGSAEPAARRPAQARA